MKIPQKLFRRATSAKNKQGVALVTVLTVMALTTILVLTFFSLATSEHRASNTYSQGLQAQQVAEQAVNMVIAQIREATTIGTTNAWASQPGAIRNWDSNGNETFAYKLYSDDDMKTLDWTEFSADFTSMQDWDQKPNHYVDLNEPVIRGEKVYYPIVHPQAATEPKWPRPIGNDDAGIEGFSFNTSTTRALPGGAFGEKASQVSQSSQHLAMPAMWIYQLADGTLGVLAPGSNDPDAEASFTAISGIGVPSENNRIVARFAFWADDETSKLNVNTHAGGLAWDIPKAGGELDMAMGRYQPAQKEFQRYPGHPATTHLIPALAPGVIDIVNDRDAMEMIFNLVPKVVGGGSESGTRPLDTRNPEEANGLVPDFEPLFPSVDDLVMRSDRTAHEFPDAQGNPVSGEDLSEYLERAKFFLTVNSRAPETNLFNQPRVAIWPIHNASYNDTDSYNKYLTSFDQLIHYCSSMGETIGANGYPRHEYIFKRENADSPTFDYEAIPRNEELYGYLAGLMDTPIPGYGGTISQKYPDPGYRQILTQIFDYIRSTNLHDDSIYKENFLDAYVTENSDEHATYTNHRNERNKQVGMKGHGQVVPITIPAPGSTDPDTKGFGRFYSLGGLQIHVISCGEPGDFPVPRHMGSTSYRNQNNNAPSTEETYLNFPPMPFVPTIGNGRIFPKFDDRPQNMDVAAYEALEPQWLEELRKPNRSPLYNLAFEPAHWNWNLAYLDQQYFDLVYASPKNTRTNADDPALFKYDPRSLSVAAFTAGDTRLKDNEQLVQGMLLFNLFTPSIGWSSINPDMEIKIELDRTNEFRFNALPQFQTSSPFPTFGVPFIGFDQFPEKEYIFSTNATDSAWGGRRYGGLMPYEFILNAGGNVNREVNRALNSSVYGPLNLSIENAGINRSHYIPLRPDTPNFNFQGGRGRYTWLDSGYTFIENALDELDVEGDLDEVSNSYRYDLVTVPFKIPGVTRASDDLLPSQLIDANHQFVPNPGTVEFTGGDITFEFYHGGEKAQGSAPITGTAVGAENGELIQSIKIDVPNFTIQYQEGDPIRTPMVFDPFSPDSYAGNTGIGGHFNEFGNLARDTFSPMERAAMGMDAPNLSNANALSDINSREDKLSIQIGAGPASVTPGNVGRIGHINTHRRPSPFSQSDIVQSIEIRHGDARVVAGDFNITPDEDVFAPHRLWDDAAMAHSVTNAVGADYTGATIEDEYLVIPDLPGNDPYRNRTPLPFGVEKSEDVQLYGDFDNGSGLMIDGPYINKPDEGNTNALKTMFQQEISGQWQELRNYGEYPYFAREWRHESGGPAYFSPNRIVSGPGMFGSLPTGVTSGEPWRTLLFRPALAGSQSPGKEQHPGGNSEGPNAVAGAVGPPDHVIMDLFWMPIVEPYAISEPLSTAGKVNINTELVPYLHVNRDTAVRGVFRSEMMVCIPNAMHQDYKHNNGRGRGYHWRDSPTGGELQGKRLRSIIREDDTLAQFTTKFGAGSTIFKSATEITEIHLMPQEVSDRYGTTRGNVGSYSPDLGEMRSGKYWSDHSLVGDNSRERPYTNIHNRITTKSNTFKVHYRAQVLKQSRRDDDSYGVWKPLFDSVQAEYRGSSIVERYVDPNLDVIPDFPNTPNKGLDEFYTYRVINPRRFAP